MTAGQRFLLFYCGTAILGISGGGGIQRTDIADGVFARTDNYLAHRHRRPRIVEAHFSAGARARKQTSLSGVKPETDQGEKAATDGGRWMASVRSTLTTARPNASCYGKSCTM